MLGRPLVKLDRSAVNFRPRVSDIEKFKKDKPAQKENEAIEFEFTIGVDHTAEFAQNMVESGLLLKEDDGKKVVKMMETQIKQLAMDRSGRLAKSNLEVDIGEEGALMAEGEEGEGAVSGERGGSSSKEPSPPSEQGQYHYQDPGLQQPPYSQVV